LGIVWIAVVDVLRRICVPWARRDRSFSRG
jgi:hypothetical protein